MPRQVPPIIARLLLVGLELTGELRSQAVERMEEAAKHIAAARYSEAMTIYEEILQNTSETSSTHESSALALEALGVFALQAGDERKAEGYLVMACPRLEQSFGPDHIKTAACKFHLGSACLRLGKYQQAEVLFQAALARYQSAFGKMGVPVASVLNGLGVLYRETGRLVDSDEVLRRAFIIRRGALGAEDPLTGRSLVELGMTSFRRGLYSQAKSNLWRALSIFERKDGKASRTVATICVALGDIFFTENDTSGADAMWRRSLAILERYQGDGWLKAQVLNSLGMSRLADRRYGEAEEFFIRATADLKSAGGASHPGSASVFANLGRAYAGQGRFDRAQNSYDVALDLAQQFGPNHPDVAVILKGMGLLRRDEGRLEEARRYFQKAIEIEEKALGPLHPKLALSLDEYAALLRRMKLKREATPLSARAAEIRRQSDSLVVVHSIDVRALKH